MEDIEELKAKIAELEKKLKEMEDSNNYWTANITPYQRSLNPFMVQYPTSLT